MENKCFNCLYGLTCVESGRECDITGSGWRPLEKSDKINHPKHYTFGNIEVIDIIEDWKLNYHEGNIIKYVARAKYKESQIDDLKKARWYLNRLIKTIEGEEK